MGGPNKSGHDGVEGGQILRAFNSAFGHFSIIHIPTRRRPMRRLFGWAIAPVLLAAAGSASAASLEIRNAALRVVVIPEARSDINITVIKANPRLPIRLSTDLAGGTVIDGGAWFTPFFGKPVWCEANGDVHIWGVGHIAN